MKASLFFFASICLTAVAQVAPPTPAIVREIGRTPIPGSSNPQGFTECGIEVFFTADAGDGGTSVYTVRAVGPVLTAFQAHHPGHPFAEAGNIRFVQSGGVVFWAVRSSPKKWQLWKYDAAVASMVIEVTGVPGIEPPSDMTARPGGGVLFAADDSVNGRELWSSDGTAAGTTLFANIAAGAASSNPQNLRTLGGTVYFAADDGVNGSELWKSDGTLVGTTMVANINAGAASSAPGPVAAGHGGILYFSADDGTNGREVWRTDGTNAGTSLVADVRAGAPGSDPSEFISFNGATYFVGRRPSANPQFPPGTIFGALYRTDGTAGGTVPAGFVNNEMHPFVSDTAAPAIYGGSLFFRFQQFPGAWSLARWNGDPGTGPLDPAPVTQIGFLDAPNPFVLTSAGLVTAEGADVVRYTHDPAPVRQVLNGAGEPQAGSPFRAIWANVSRLYFGGVTADAGTELAYAPVAGLGTSLVSDINPSVLYDNTPSGEIERITAFSGRVLVTTAGQLRPAELWMSDGTAPNTTLLASYPTGHKLTGPFVFGSKALSFHQSPAVPTFAQEIVAIGSNGATTTLGSFSVGQYAPYLAALGGFAYFNGITVLDGEELWRTDGTIAGTARLTDIAAGADFSRINAVMTGGPWVYFTTSNGIADDVRRINAAGIVETVALPPGSLPRLIGAVNDRMSLARGSGQVFSVGPGAADVVELNAGSPLSIPAFGNAATLGGRLYFAANDFSVFGQELWSTDGTPAGTAIVKDIFAGASGSSASLLAAGSDRVNFAAFDGVDFGLWRSDGTLAGTSKIAAVPPFELAALRTGAWFTSNTPATGNELWQSDGTLAGTSGFDIEPGAASSFPSLITPVATWRGTVAFFAAATTGHNLELWVTPPTTGNAYSAWSAANANNVSPEGDPDGDGIPNLLEWALGLSPGEPDGAPVAMALSGAAASATFKTLTPVPAGLSYFIETTPNLMTPWVSAVRIDSLGVHELVAGAVTVTGPVPGPKPGTQCFTATLPAGAMGFVRVRVTFEF